MLGPASGLVLLSCLLAQEEPLELPGPGLDLPVDADGDGISTFGDRYFFNWWVERGGSVEKAISAATIAGELIDVSGFFSSPDAQLAPIKSEGTQAAEAIEATCIPPANTPNHTRRIPPDRQLNVPSFHPRMTPDGRFVVFSSIGTTAAPANHLVVCPPNGSAPVARQIFRFEQSTASSTAVYVHVSKAQDGSCAASPAPGIPGDCDRPSISKNGGRVVFETRAKLTSDDTDTVRDIYLWDPAKQPAILRLSKAIPVTSGSRGDSRSPDIGPSQNVRFRGSGALPDCVSEA